MEPVWCWTKLAPCCPRWWSCLRFVSFGEKTILFAYLGGIPPHPFWVDSINRFSPLTVYLEPKSVWLPNSNKAFPANQTYSQQSWDFSHGICPKSIPWSRKPTLQLRFCKVSFRLYHEPKTRHSLWLLNVILRDTESLPQWLAQPMDWHQIRDRDLSLPLRHCDQIDIKIDKIGKCFARLLTNTYHIINWPYNLNLNSKPNIVPTKPFQPFLKFQCPLPWTQTNFASMPPLQSKCQHCSVGWSNRCWRLPESVP